MNLPHSQLLINEQNDKEVIMSTINSVILRSSTPTINLNSELMLLQNSVLNIKQDSCFQITDLQSISKRQAQHVPSFKTKKINIQTTQSLKPINTRLPATTSLTPGPQAYTPVAQYNLGMINSCPGFSLSSRYDKNRDFSKTNGLLVGPGQYDVTRDKYNMLSSSKQTKQIKIKAFDENKNYFGPGPGKYLTKTDSLSTGKIVHNLHLNDGRQTSFGNFADLKETKFKPGVGTYNPNFDFDRQHNVSSTITPESNTKCMQRNFNGIKATQNCPDCYQYNLNKVSRKLTPNNCSSFLEK
ncbi:hypothetical protein SS50377_21262 [Spironucleus salmonicida]|uniref:Uncharacterized protein n=1 Tax=Spironucleus salmonicida TaxID=348837 RepID=V6LI90_9EUKA|nr:hypothetical protein SS50377_21262 [Spironucleus salmonicida]|eukprot:EST44033.1 Hypothetical protein SS50377_16342 [Spironucleus salmonicida]